METSLTRIFIVLCLAAFIHGFKLDSSTNQEYNKQDILSKLSDTEKYLVFGNSKKYEFDIVYPQWITNGQKSKLKLSELEFEVELELSKSFILENVVVDAPANMKARNLNHKNCHWRTVGKSAIVAVSDCTPTGIYGMIIANELHHNLYPLHFLRQRQSNEPLPYLLSKVDRSSIAQLLQGSLSKQKLEGRSNATNPFLEKFDDHHLTNDVRIDLDEDLDRFRVQTNEKPVKFIPLVAEDWETSMVKIQSRKTVEIAIFCDFHLLRRFENLQIGGAPFEILDYVSILVNALEGIYHQEELRGYIVDFKVVRVGLLSQNQGPRLQGTDISRYLDNFCSWQNNQNPRSDDDDDHWDNAMLLTGLDMTSGGHKGVVGLAWVSGMCSRDFSCSISEGGTFLSTYVIAHELGHNFGMDHDGSRESSNCNSNNHVMSPSIGSGKTTWSDCSAQLLKQFLSKSTCLDDNQRPTVDISTTTSTTTVSTTTEAPKLPPSTNRVKERLPGQLFPPAKQCELAFGKDYMPVTSESMCEYLFCSNGSLRRGAHVALQGSECNNKKICIAGSCKPESELERLIVLFHNVFQELQPNSICDYLN